MKFIKLSINGQLREEEEFAMSDLTATFKRQIICIASKKTKELICNF